MQNARQFFFSIFSIYFIIVFFLTSCSCCFVSFYWKCFFMNVFLLYCHNPDNVCIRTEYGLFSFVVVVINIGIEFFFFFFLIAKFNQSHISQYMESSMQRNKVKMMPSSWNVQTEFFWVCYWWMWALLNWEPFYDSWPQSETTIFLFVFPLWVPQPSIFLITSIPSTTVPKTTWRLSNQEVFTVVMKNCEPFVFGPALACVSFCFFFQKIYVSWEKNEKLPNWPTIDNVPGLRCFKVKFSSSNLLP